MKIVIDIPEEEYEEILSSEDCGLHMLTRAVANGTPLPKGHGRLIDKDKIKCSNCGYLGCDNSDLCAIYNAQTIINADGGNEE